MQSGFVFLQKGKHYSLLPFIPDCIYSFIFVQFVTCFLPYYVLVPLLEESHSHVYTNYKFRLMIYTSTGFISLHLSNKNTLFSKKWFSINGNTCALAGMCTSHSVFSQFHKQWLNLEWMWLWSAVRVWGQITQMKVHMCQASCCWPWIGLGWGCWPFKQTLSFPHIKNSKPLDPTFGSWQCNNFPPVCMYYGHMGFCEGEGKKTAKDCLNASSPLANHLNPLGFFKCFSIHKLERFPFKFYLLIIWCFLHHTISCLQDEMECLFLSSVSLLHANCWNFAKFNHAFFFMPSLSLIQILILMTVFSCQQKARFSS